MNIKPCMVQISGTWELLLCEYWRKSMIIGEKNTDLKRLTGRLKLRFLTEIGRFHWNHAWFGEHWYVLYNYILLYSSLHQKPPVYNQNRKKQHRNRACNPRAWTINLSTVIGLKVSNIRILSTKSMWNHHRQLLYVYYMSELQYILDINCKSVLATFILN